jgi:hypothetical protein
MGKGPINFERKKICGNVEAKLLTDTTSDKKQQK